MPHHTRRRALVRLLILVAILAPGTLRAEAPRFVALGGLPGDRGRCAPVAVSTDGSVVIGNGYAMAGPEAFRWTAATGTVGLGDLPGGGHFSVARAATPGGDVVAGISESAVGVEPFRWTAETGLRPLVPFGAGDHCDVSALSRRGDAVVGACRIPLFDDGDPFPSAWIWTASDGFHWLAGVPWFGERSVAQSVSADRRAVFGWIETGVQSASGSSATRRDAVRFDAGNDGVFGTADDRRIVLDPAFIANPEIPIAASADGLRAIGTGERRGQLFSFLWTAGNDRRAGTADDSFRSLSARGASGTCIPFGISADGRTPFGACLARAGSIDPARWTAATGWAPLGDAPKGGSVGYAVGASADGATLVGFFDVQRGPAPWDVTFRPFRWTAATGLSLFSSVAPENADCDRCVVVSSDGGDVLAAEGGSRGDGLFLWSAGRGRRHLDELPGDWQASYGAAISDDGLVVAGTSRSGEGDRAFRWTEHDGMTPVGPPGSRGVEVSLSDDGATLLGVLPWDRTSLAARAAFFHRAGASDIESLGPGVAGATGCYPTKLSGDGTTVVGDCVGGVQAPAFSWTAASGLLPIQVPTDHFDWQCSASAVSRSGAVVGITCERPIGAVTTESRALLSTGLSAPLRDLRPALAGDLLRIVDLSADGLVALGEDRSNGMRRGFRWALDTGSVLIPSVSGSRELPGASTQSGMDTSFSVVTSGGRGATPLDLTPDGTQSLFHTAGALGRLTPASDFLQALPSPALGSAGPIRGGLLSADGNTAIAMYERRGPSRGTHLVHATRIWIWDAANGGRWLDAALAAAGVDVSGWTLERIVDMSADGKHLLGNGIDPAGRVEAWLVVLP